MDRAVFEESVSTASSTNCIRLYLCRTHLPICGVNDATSSAPQGGCRGGCIEVVAFGNIIVVSCCKLVRYVGLGRSRLRIAISGVV